MQNEDKYKFWQLNNGNGACVQRLAGDLARVGSRDYDSAVLC
jgi:hypothetical protein